MAMMSGRTSSCSQANNVPVRPMPHITSSKISSTPYWSQISRIRLKYPGTGGTAPDVAPTTGSATKAKTVSAPSRKISASSSLAARNP